MRVIAVGDLTTQNSAAGLLGKLIALAIIVEAATVVAVRVYARIRD